MNTTTWIIPLFSFEYFLLFERLKLHIAVGQILFYLTQWLRSYLYEMLKERNAVSSVTELDNIEIMIRLETWVIQNSVDGISY